MTMAGIHGFGNVNKGVNFGGLNQAGNAKNAQQAKNETELKLNTNQVDGFVKSNNAEQTREEDKPKINEGGDGKKKGWKEKLSEFSRRYGEALKRNNATFELDDFVTAFGQAIGSYGWNEDPFQ